MSIYNSLTKDHDQIKMLLNELIATNPGEEVRDGLIDEIRDELVPHSRAEEAVFYNSLRALDEAKDIIMHAYKEHMEAETLLRSLQVQGKIDMGWKETARKLREALLHHIQEEEGRIFNVAQQLFTDEEAEMMANAFEKLKPEIEDEGFMQTSLELIVNLMPQRFAPSLRAINLEKRI